MKREKKAPTRGGAHDNTVAYLSRAAVLFAQGKTLKQAAKTLSIPEATLITARRNHPGVFEAAHDAAKQKVIEAVRKAIGTDAVLADPDAFLAMARQAEQFATERGEPLLPPCDEQTITTFYESYYRPMCLSDIDWPNHRLIVPAANLKQRRPQIVHLNEAAYRHLLAIRTDREKVFEWPYTLRIFHDDWHRLLSLAGIVRKDHFGLHTLRKTLATMLWEHSPQAAQYALGHAGDEVTRQHYVAGGSLVVKALDALPQPSAFKS